MPHAAIPSLLGVLEASLDARDCGCRAVVCICTEALELPDLLTEEGRFSAAAPSDCGGLTVQPCHSVFVPFCALWVLSDERYRSEDVD